MNLYQKFSIFLLRLLGGVIAILGLMGPFYTAIELILGNDAPDYSHEKWMGSISWAIIGILLIVFSKPLGRLLGHGLE